MNTINQYVENLFEHLPNNQRLAEAQQEILTSMLDKYEDLKADGYSENEAIGIVISEFGNIDELLEEMGILANQNDFDESSEGLLALEREEVEQYIEVNRKSGLLIGLGVLLCICSPSMIILASSNVKMILFGVIPLIICVTIAVGLFIFAGFQLKSYQYLREPFILPTYLKNELVQEEKQFQGKFVLGLVIGIGLIISSVMPIMLSVINHEIFWWHISIVVLLGLVSVGVFSIIYVSIIESAYKNLLKPTKEKIIEKNKMNYLNPSQVFFG